MLRSLLTASILLGAVFVAPSRAVIVAGGDGTQNTTAPTGGNDFGFANVGIVGGASGVYLGDGWFITAYHVSGLSFGNVTFGGQSYSVDNSSAVRLNTAGSLADIVVAHISGVVPNLPSLNLSASTPGTGASLVMAGDGRNRDPNQTSWWDLGGTWTESVGGNRKGYKWGTGNTLRWGTNNRTSDAISIEDYGAGPTSVFRTQFDNTNGEAQAAVGDSGGGVFYNNGANWELAGLMVVTASYANQPGETAVFGDQTYMVDLASYRGQILSIIPEPSSALLVSAGVLAAFGRRPKRKT